MARKDINTTAFAVVQQAIGETEPPTARTLASRKGGLKGGKTRMDSLTHEQRSELGRQAAAKRWAIAAPAIEADAAKGRLAKKL